MKALKEDGDTEEARDYVFRGRLVDCFRHFADAMNRQFPKGSVKVYEGRKPLWEFCGVNPHTASEWLLRGASLEGMSWFKLAFFLKIQNYGVTDFDRIREVVRKFAALIVFGLLKVEEAQHLLNYGQLKNLYRTLRGENKLPDEKMKVMWDIWKEKRNELTVRMEEAKEKYRIRELSNSAILQVNVPPSIETINEPGYHLSEEITPILDIIRGLKGLLDSKPFDDLSETEFDAVVRKSRSEILDLYKHLSDLSVRIVDARGTRDGH